MAHDIADIVPEYGFEVISIAEGWKVTYHRVRAPLRLYVKAAAAIGCGAFAALGISFTLAGSLFAWIPILFLGAIALRLRYVFVKRVRHPTTFVVGPEHLVVGSQRFEKQHISRLYVADSMGEPSHVHTSGTGGFALGGTGLAGAGLAGVNAASHAMRDSGRQFGESIDQDLKSISKQVRFTYGEGEQVLANGLDLARAEALLDRVVELMGTTGP